MEILLYILYLTGVLAMGISAPSWEERRLLKKITDVAALACLVSLFFAATYIYDGRYKDGQVDALTGEVNYELVQHADSTKTWQKIDKEN